MSVMDFLTRLFGTPEPSGRVAKERLRLVLVQDRASMSPEILESLKTDLIGVISKYLEIDQDGLEVNLDRADDTVALVANIPVRRVKRAGLVGE